MGPQLRRKSVRHFDHLNHVHELTFSCYRRLPLLEDDNRRCLLSDSIVNALNGQGFALLAFVYMPEHVHLVVWPELSASKIAPLLFAIKRPFSFRVKQTLQSENNPLLKELTIRESEDKMCFRFWQAGPGYDRNLDNPKAIASSIEYVHNNPVKRGLCSTPGEWRWSSWNQYHHVGHPLDKAVPIVRQFPW